MKNVISLLIIGFNLSAYAENVDLGRQLMCLNGTKILQGVHKYVCTHSLEIEADSLDDLDAQVLEYSKKNMKDEGLSVSEAYHVAWYRCGAIGERITYQLDNDQQFTASTYSYHDLDGRIRGLYVSGANEEKLAEKQILSHLEKKLEVKFRLNGLKDFISCRELLK